MYHKNGHHFPLLALLLACSGPKVEWIEGEGQADGRAQHSLVLHNVPGGSRVWFQELYDRIEVTEPEGCTIQHFQGTSVYLDIPTDAPNPLIVKYFERALPRHSWAPEGFVLQQQGKEDRPLEVTYHFLERKGTPVSADWYAARYPVQPGDLIPRPKRIEYGAPSFPMEEHTTRPEGWYRITVSGGEAKLEAGDRNGELYARQTLDKLPEECPDMVIEDWPDLGLRGFMLDVVRDFRSKDEVLKILDIMASYKLNLLHFHIGDDEAWCLEIPGLPELTDFSGRHALPDWDLQETRALKPTANGRIGNSTFYTGEEYGEILRYAWERGICVVPEFDAPGHSRASIKAMQAYERRTGDSSFRLQDPADTSRYWSAQDFTDNVLDPDYPGVYKFYGVVFDEVIRMHREAGVPLPGIHIGGDEVPGGTWAGRDRRQLKDKFTRGMLALAQGARREAGRLAGNGAGHRTRNPGSAQAAASFRECLEHPGRRYRTHLPAGQRGHPRPPFQRPERLCGPRLHRRSRGNRPPLGRLCGRAEGLRPAAVADLRVGPMGGRGQPGGLGPRRRRPPRAGKAGNDCGCRGPALVGEPPQLRRRHLPDAAQGPGNLGTGLEFAPGLAHGRGLQGRFRPFLFHREGGGNAALGCAGICLQKENQHILI